MVYYNVFIILEKPFQSRFGPGFRNWHSLFSRFICRVIVEVSITFFFCFLCSSTLYISAAYNVRLNIIDTDDFGVSLNR